jgi:DNA-binding PadR family transcriptional regulator
MMPRMGRDPRDLLPLKPLVFQILLALTAGERHGWSLVRELDRAGGGARLLPGQLYRTLDGMLAEGLIEESDVPREPVRAGAAGGAAPRRFFRLSAFGLAVARAEAQRLEALVEKSRASRLLKAR